MDIRKFRIFENHSQTIITRRIQISRIYQLYAQGLIEEFTRNINERYD